MNHLSKRASGTYAGIVILLLLAAAPVSAQVIQQGIDALQTAAGTSSTVNLPADFFCRGSAPVSQTVQFTGSPLATNPPGALGATDTIVERLKDAFLPDGACAEVPVVVRALSLTSIDTITATCDTGDTTWAVEACTCGCCGVQPITRITICDDGTGCGCGTFTGDLQIDVCLKFRNLADGTILGPVQQRVTLLVNTPWCDKNPGGAVEYGDAVMVDTDCNDQADLAVPCTTNFFPGATCGGGGCPPPVCHEGPTPDHQHCVEQCREQTAQPAQPVSF